MTNDEWRMANGEWRVASGEWRSTNDEARRKPESMTKRRSQRVCHSFVIRHSDFVILIDVALVALIALQFLNVFVRLLFALAALFLNDFPQRGVDILGHAPRVAANKEMRAVRIHPFPTLGGIFQHLVLDVRFAGLIARPGAIATGEKSSALLLLQFLAIKIIAMLMLRPEKEPILPLRPGF